MVHFSPSRKVTHYPGVTYEFSDYSTDGEALNRVDRYLNPALHSDFDARAVINSRHYIRLSSGPFSGRWTPITLETLLDE